MSGAGEAGPPGSARGRARAPPRDHGRVKLTEAACLQRRGAAPSLATAARVRATRRRERFDDYESLSPDSPTATWSRSQRVNVVTSCRAADVGVTISQ